MEPTRQLDTTSAEHIIYKNGMLDITILGGIRLEGLDRMRVTLKIQIEHQAIRHNLDLYNDTQVEKLIRKVAEKLEVGTSGVITKWLKLYNLRQVQYLAGHKWISSTEEYLQNEMEGLQEEINKYHPLG